MAFQYTFLNIYNDIFISLNVAFHYQKYNYAQNYFKGVNELIFNINVN